MVLPENVMGVASAGEDAEGRAGKAAEAHCGARPVPERLQSPDLHAHPELSADPTGMACALPKQGAPVLCALVTGATGGIGRELCAELVRDHGTLAIVGRSREKLDELAKHLSERYDVDVRVFVADFAQPGAIDVLVAQVRAANLQVETLVNNAGFGYDAPFAESSLERQRALVQTNDVTLMELCHAFAPDMAARGHGGILNVASVAGFVPGPYMSTYYASKAFVQSFSSALHMELRPHGVHVTALCPGPVRTPFWDNADAGETALARLTISASRVARAAVRALACNRLLSGRAGENHRVRQPPCAAHVGRCGSGVVAETEKIRGRGAPSSNSRLHSLRLRVARAKMAKCASFLMHEVVTRAFLELSTAN